MVIFIAHFEISCSKIMPLVGSIVSYAAYIINYCFFEELGSGKVDRATGGV